MLKEKNFPKKRPAGGLFAEKSRRDTFLLLGIISESATLLFEHVPFAFGAD